MATAKQTPANTPDTQTENKPEAFTFSEVTSKNLGDIAKALWERIEGEKHADRASVANELITAIREARDAGKTTRVQRSSEEVVQESLNKSMADLQTVRVELGGLKLPLPAVVRMADESQAKQPLHKAAVEFLAKHKVKAVAEKQGSRGKATTFLRPLDYEPQAQEPKAA